MVYLEHVIRNDMSDTLVENIVRDFNSKFNRFIADILCINYVVKNKLNIKY